MRWKSGFNKEIGLYYWICKVSNVEASQMYSSYCDRERRLAITCTNEKVNWVEGDYNFIVYGKDKQYVDDAKRECEASLKKRKV
ncbi:MAG: hypothetical protein E7279_10155 [Lachnospiraceae bacterium]|nr:hypothetical protein [Lachnospiraceae bacterium]